MFQIDDGWEPKVGDWLETDAQKFPHGLKGMVEEIHAAGFQAGLWLAPFLAMFFTISGPVPPAADP